MLLSEIQDNERWIIGPTGSGKTTLLVNRGQELIEQFGADTVITLGKSRCATLSLDNPWAQYRSLYKVCTEVYWEKLGRKPQVQKYFYELWNASFPSWKLSHPTGSALTVWPAPSKEFLGDVLMKKIEKLRHELTPANEWLPEEKRFFEAYVEIKEQVDEYNFTDLLEKALADIEYLPDPPAYILADDVQEWSPLEFTVLRKLAVKADLCHLACNPNIAVHYSIYQPMFSADNINKFKQNILLLNESFIHSMSVCHTANTLMSRSRQKLDVELVSNINIGSTRRLKAGYKEPAMIVDEVEACIAACQSIMILAASSHFLSPIIGELRERGIIFHNPAASKIQAWNPLTQGAVQAILAFLRPSRIFGIGLGESWEIEDVYRFARIFEIEIEHSASSRQRLFDILRSRAYPEDVLPRLKHVIPIGEEFISAALNGDLEFVRDRVIAKAQSAIDYLMNIKTRDRFVTLSDNPKVIVGDIQSVKHLYANTVFLTPDLSINQMSDWLSDGGKRERLLRIFNLGITRATNNLVICNSNSKYAIDNLL